MNISSENLYPAELILITFMILGLIVFVLFKWMKFEKTEKNITLLLIVLMFCLIGGISIAGIAQANDVKNRRIYNGTSVFVNDIEIKSNDTLFYIGETNNYVFYFNSKATTR